MGDEIRMFKFTSLMCSIFSMRCDDGIHFDYSTKQVVPTLATGGYGPASLAWRTALDPTEKLALLDLVA
jgi:hypothetical protein